MQHHIIMRQKHSVSLRRQYIIGEACGLLWQKIAPAVNGMGVVYLCSLFYVLYSVVTCCNYHVTANVRFLHGGYRVVLFKV